MLPYTVSLSHWNADNDDYYDIIKLFIILLLVWFTGYPISDLKKPMGYATLLKAFTVADII